MPISQVEKTTEYTTDGNIPENAIDKSNPIHPQNDEKRMEEICSELKNPIVEKYTEETTKIGRKSFKRSFEFQCMDSNSYTYLDLILIFSKEGLLRKLEVKKGESRAHIPLNKRTNHNKITKSITYQNKDGLAMICNHNREIYKREPIICSQTSRLINITEKTQRRITTRVETYQDNPIQERESTFHIITQLNLRTKQEILISIEHRKNNELVEFFDNKLSLRYRKKKFTNFKEEIKPKKDKDKARSAFLKSVLRRTLKK